MINVSLFNSMALLTNMIEKKPSGIIGYISIFLGWILNFLFNIVHSLTVNNSLGLSIILFTIVVRTLMLPIAFKQQKSMVSMRKVQPETEKIKAKYADKTDPESQKKMNLEVQQLYSKNKINPLSGCLPMLITLPIFFALSTLMRQSYLYVDVIGGVYNNISNILIDNVADSANILESLVVGKIPKGLELISNIPEDVSMILNKLTIDEWKILLSEVRTISADSADTIASLLKEKQMIESFFGLDLTMATGWGFPGVIIPVLTGVTTFLSTWISNKQQGTSTDSTMRSQQTMMLVIMPVMMTWMTTSLSAGVGIYWIVSSLYQTIQQVLLNQYYVRNGTALVGVDDVIEAKEIIVVDKSINKKKGGK